MKYKDPNLKTEKSLINQINKMKIDGGISNCIRYENNFFFNFVNLKNKDLIEFGCGIYPSSFGIAKNKMPKNYFATDVSKRIIEIAKKNDDKPIYKVINLEKKINLNKKFDIIILKGVLHHTKNPEKILIKLKKILKKKGLIIISEPNLSSIVGNFLKFILKLLFNKDMEDSPYGQYNYKKISKSINNANLLISKKWYTQFVLIIASGDYGRIKIFPDSVYLFKFFILMENICFYILSFFQISKFVNFKINLIVKK
jgi:2-polyprenyl-3-methyl-5-hydroxy-6-metoxy-1,4-benzoquinol methylase